MAPAHPVGPLKGRSPRAPSSFLESHISGLPHPVEANSQILRKKAPAGHLASLRPFPEIGSITSAELAANWAREALAAKNKLAAPDGKLVEDTFELSLSELAAAGTSPAAADVAAIADAEPQATRRAASADLGQSVGIDKSVLAVAAPRRYRNREHLRSVAKQPCLICGRKPSDPHHLRYLLPRALGRKASDEFAVPLCRVHHRALHRARDEQAWWQAAGIDPIQVARKL